ncbi:hypothetical protein PR202_ga12773 [Eleusine coracana subsp. coracana]|uniref:Uncharacterized protein n=1 Tax=Eleusine coracana subsp. coracana TaxID=191504 RepID=A0AAV5CCZ5_ELECO|nr:hypothetical protein PR202_ga12773 [Eleusine coracana subsp. coracana]
MPSRAVSAAAAAIAEKMKDRILPLPSAFQIRFNTDDEDEWPQEATLLSAAYSGNIRRLKEVATRLDADGRGVVSTLRRTNFEGMNALHAAAGGKGLLPMCRYLVEEVRMDVNKRDTTNGKNMTPLQHAVSGGNLPALRYLLDKGADLHLASHLKGRCEIAKHLLSTGAHVDGESCRSTPLHAAVTGGHDSTVKILLDHHAYPNREVNLVTPVDIALDTPSLPCLKLLILAGAEVNGVNNPLARAAREGLTEAIKCLLEAGANPNIPNMFGKLPIEIAAEYGTREDVEIMFPFTSPIPTVTDWSVDGIISHIKLERKQLEDGGFVEKKRSELRRQGDDAFKKQEYTNSSALYTQAVRIDPYDATLFSNRSLCWHRMGDGKRALQDALMCKKQRPIWAKAYYRQGAALMLLKDYAKACEVLSEGLELDPESDEIDKLYWEAMELKSTSTTVA